jgi:hypothetical protein
MAKRDRSPAEDYLAHIDWHTRNRPGRPVSTSTEPEWNYKIAYPKRPTSSLAVRVLFISGAIVLAGYGVYKTFLVDSAYAVFLGIILLIIGAIFFFAVRDASKPNRPIDN